jgi:hypothetical protein
MSEMNTQLAVKCIKEVIAQEESSVKVVLGNVPAWREKMDAFKFSVDAMTQAESQAAEIARLKDEVRVLRGKLDGV